MPVEICKYPQLLVNPESGVPDVEPIDDCPGSVALTKADEIQGQSRAEPVRHHARTTMGTSCVI